MRRLLVRGESLVASAGIGLAFVVVAAVAAAAWWTLQLSRTQNETAAVERTRSIASILAESSSVMLSHGDLGATRRLVMEIGNDPQITSCRIVLPDGKTLADANPKSITSLKLPESWPASVQRPDVEPNIDRGDKSLAKVSQVFDIPQRGIARLEIEANLTQSWWSYWEALAGIGAIGAGALGAMLLVYRRLRGRLRALSAIREALIAISSGERAMTALSVHGDSAPETKAWNELLESVDGMRRQSAAEQARQALGSRGGGSVAGLDGACDAMSQGIVLVDHDLRVRYANGAAAVFLRARRDDLIGRDIGAFMKNADVLSAVRGAVTGAVRQRAQFEIERQGEEGDKGLLRFNIRPVRKDDAAAAMIVIEDITQQRVAEEARHAFVAQATHELRTPLTNIRLYVETAIDDGENDPKVRADCLNVINSETRRLERIVGDMLSVAEIEAGAMQLRRDDVHLRELFDQLEHDYQVQAQDKHIQLSFKLAPKLPLVQGDHDRIALALHNLVGNALKYTPDGGQVNVAVDGDDESIRVEVADTGIGIGEEDCKKLFEKFYRAKDRRIENITGSGLGLALARQVARLHGGDITVESELNKGSRFTLTLPAQSKAA